MTIETYRILRAENMPREEAIRLAREEHDRRTENKRKSPKPEPQFQKRGRR